MRVRPSAFACSVRLPALSHRQTDDEEVKCRRFASANLIAFRWDERYTNEIHDLKVKDERHQLWWASGGTAPARKLPLKQSIVTVLNLNSSLFALPTAGGAGDAIVTRRLIFHS